MAMSDEIKEQTKKLKDMSAKERINYIWTYYRLWIIGGLIFIIAVSSITKTVIRNNRPVYLGAMFINSKVATNFLNCTLENDFADALGVDLSKNNMEFDYVTHIDDEYDDQTSYAGQIKVISKISASTLDILCGPESVLNGPADVGGFIKFEEVFTEEELKAIENKGYEFYYYTEKIYDEEASADQNGDVPYTEGPKYMAGIYIDNCQKLTGDASSTVYDEQPEDRNVLTIALNTQNIDHAKEFIEFVTE